jgi:hypothetical protein
MLKKMLGKSDSMLLTQLNIIAKIREQNKIRTKSDELSIEKRGILPVGWLRWFHGENRHINIERISLVFNNAFTLVEKKISNHDKIGYTTYMNAIKEAKAGVCNLRVTYERDQAFTSKIDVLLTNIDAAIQKFTYDFNQWPLY